MNQTQNKIAEIIKKFRYIYQGIQPAFFDALAKELADLLCKTKEGRKEFLKECGVN